MQSVRALKPAAVMFTSTLCLASVAAHAAQPVGSLQIRGAAVVSASATGEQTRLADTDYAWFSGDRLVTRDSTGILQLENGGSLGVDKQSDVTVFVEGRQLNVELEAGSLLYALEQTSTMEVQVGDYRLSTTNGQVAATQVSVALDGAAGSITRTDEGEVKVSVRGGELVLNGDAGQHYVVASGEEAVISGSNFQRVTTQLPQNQSSASQSGGWISNNKSLFTGLVLIGAAGAYVIYENNDDDDDDQPVSP